MVGPLRRPMGNAQSRQTSLGRAPQYGATTNPNGAQTASRLPQVQNPNLDLPFGHGKDPYRTSPISLYKAVGLTPPAAPQYGATTNPNGAQTASRTSLSGNDPSNPSFWTNAGPQQPPVQTLLNTPQNQQSSPAQTLLNVPGQHSGQIMQYAGGDVAGQAQYYRNTALQGYQAKTGLNLPFENNPKNAFQTSPMPAGPQSVNPNQLPPISLNENAQGWVGPREPIGGFARRVTGMDPNAAIRGTPATGYDVPSPTSSLGASSNAQGMLHSDAMPQSRSALGNGYNGFVGDMNDPNRLTPDQKFQLAQQSAQGAMNYDPTNQGGNRFAAGAARIQAEDAYNQAAVAAGTQAEQQRMQGIAADSPQRAMDPNSQSRQFSYQNAQGEMVATNRLGQLQQLQQQNPNDLQVQLAIAEEKQKQSALGEKQENFQARYAAAHGGLGDKDRRRLGYKNQVINRAVRAGIIQEDGPDGAGERRYNADQFVREQGAFRQSERKFRRSALNAENAKTLGTLQDRLAKSDRTVDANGQLNPTIRDAAKSTLTNIANPNYQGSREFKENQRQVQAYGLTPWAAEDDGFFTSGGDSPAKVVDKVLGKGGIKNLQQAQALRKYWNAQKDSDSSWINQSDAEDGATAFMNEMAAVPESELPAWFEENKQRMARFEFHQRTGMR